MPDSGVPVVMSVTRPLMVPVVCWALAMAGRNETRNETTTAKASEAIFERKEVMPVLSECVVVMASP
jgi:hypothetical protein